MSQLGGTAPLLGLLAGLAAACAHPIGPPIAEAPHPAAAGQEPSETPAGPDSGSPLDDPEALAPSPAPPLEASTPTPAWARPLVDLHVDTISRVRAGGLDLASAPELESSLDKLDAVGVGLIVEAAWVPAAHRAPDPHRYAVETVTALRREIEARPDRWRLVLGPDDLDALRWEDRAGALLALEGGHAIRSPEDVSLFAALGVRMIGLTWSISNALCGSSGDAPQPGAGLTLLGQAVVREAGRMGIAIDLAHASDACIEDVLNVSAAPVLASHSNARALRDVPRNLSDAQLQRIAEGGGLVGVMFHGPFVAEAPTLEGVAAHALHLARIMGPEHVAIGSDFDGSIVTPNGLRTTLDLPALAQALTEAGLTAEEVRGIMGANARRYLREVWGSAEDPPPPLLPLDPAP